MIVLTSVLILNIFVGADIVGCRSASDTAAAHHVSNEMEAKCGMIYLEQLGLDITGFVEVQSMG